MTSATSNTPWQVLVVRPRSEKKTGQRLRELGFEACVPTQWQYRQWSDRRKKVEVVLFPNYVFIAADPARHNEVFRAGNIMRYLSLGGRIAALSEREVAMIKQLACLEAPVSIAYEGFRAGDEVEILGGSLAGYRGLVTGQNGARRLQVALPGLGCFAEVELRDTELLKIPI
ncbi:MAG: Transcription antitermination protein RfaH [Haliscomenobacter sp.]|jgi:transcriptional antiterminator RfaH|nr:Transcription antitermination protein RfaH [Haliscomenobacter sp.]